MKKFNEYVNENRMKFEISVEEPYTQRTEANAAARTKIYADPIQIIYAEGVISEYVIDFFLEFSNEDAIEVQLDPEDSSIREIVIVRQGSRRIDITNRRIMHFGETGSLVQDAAMVYQSFIRGEI